MFAVGNKSALQNWTSKSIQCQILQKILESQTVQIAKKNLFLQHWKNLVEVHKVFQESLACSMQEDTTQRSDAAS